MIRQRKVNGWFVRDDFSKVAQAVGEVARTEPTRWVKHGIDCKYVEVRVDMRTGDFCIKNAFGGLVDADTLLAMFPDLGPIEQV